MLEPVLRVGLDSSAAIIDDELLFDVNEYASFHRQSWNDRDYRIPVANNASQGNASGVREEPYYLRGWPSIHFLNYGEKGAAYKWNDKSTYLYKPSGFRSQIPLLPRDSCFEVNSFQKYCVWVTWGTLLAVLSCKKRPPREEPWWP